MIDKETNLFSHRYPETALGRDLTVFFQVARLQLITQAFHGYPHPAHCCVKLLRSFPNSADDFRGSIFSESATEQCDFLSAQRPMNGDKINVDKAGEKEGPAKDCQINAARRNIA